MSGNDQALAKLDAMIARIRSLPKAMVEEGAQDVADVLEAEQRASAAAGTTPDGQAWAARKADGGRALANAADAVHIAAVGATIFIRLVGIEVRHQRGRVRGGTVRQIIPTALPKAWAVKVGHALTRRFSEHFAG